MTENPKIEAIVSFSFDYIYCLGDYILHSKLLEGDIVIVNNFSLPKNIYSRRLFVYSYWVFLEHNRNNLKNPWRLNCDYCWDVNVNLPNKGIFVSEVLDKYRLNLEENLRLAIQSSS